MLFKGYYFKVEWLKNDEALRLENPHKYQIVGNGTALKIRSIDFADTGAYMCQATNVGKQQFVIIIQDNNIPLLMVYIAYSHFPYHF